MSEAHEVKGPYVGPGPFEEDRTLYGRAEEEQDLMYFLRAERIVLLYSPSGAGKTSLIRAALIPKLRDARFGVLPIVSLRWQPAEPGLKPRNRYVFSTLLSLEAEQKEPLPPEQLATMTLLDYLAQRAAGAPLRDRVLIFDQFEELLTLDPTDEDEKRQFLEEVAQVLSFAVSADGSPAEGVDDDEFLADARYRYPYWALFAMREDYLAALDPYKLIVPTRFANRFRLDFLRPEAAREAITKPVEAIGGTFELDAANSLVDELRRVNVQDRPDASPAESSGPYVEPVHLQIVCKTIWDSRPADTLRIGLDQLRQPEGALSSVDAALQQYYAAEVKKAADAAHGSPDERTIRDWFERELMTPQGIRTQVDHGPGGGKEVPQSLLDAYLVRCEQERGGMWYTLAHDRLVGPIRKSNGEWAERHLVEVQREAVRWERAGRPRDMLLQGGKLATAEKWSRALDHPLTATERAFLDASRNRQNMTTLTWVATVAATIIIAVAALHIQARYDAIIRDRMEAEVRARDTEIRRLKTGQTLRDTEQKLREKEQALKNAIQDLNRAQDELARISEKLGFQQTLKTAADLPDAVARVRDRDVDRIAQGKCKREVFELVLHHTGTRSSTFFDRECGGQTLLRAIYLYRRLQLHQDMYHYLVGPDGRTWQGRSIDVSDGDRAVRVALILDGATESPRSAQVTATGKLLSALMKCCNVAEKNIRKDGSRPGRRVDLSAILEAIPKPPEPPKPSTSDDNTISNDGGPQRSTPRQTSGGGNTNGQ
ncbi:MAG: N-acetylmuramoyl-L-alanine amidase [Armatimonadetes bacterium]|nr:N-acetylmuramoyl-L-alanine amidase [Armatimonadota bacterium]